MGGGGDFPPVFVVEGEPAKKKKGNVEQAAHPGRDGKKRKSFQNTFGELRPRPPSIKPAILDKEHFK